MNLKKVVAGLTLALGLGLMASTSAHASEGQIEMRNVTQSEPHCYAVSAYLPGEAQYNILVICRNLIYPVSPEALKYVVWITPANGSAAQRLGDLAFGKVAFKTKTPFSSMFVSQEKDTNVNVPTGPTVMRGNVRTISFLDNGSAPAPSENKEEIVASPTPAAARSNVLSFFRSGAVLTVIAIFVILLMLILVKPFK